MRSSSQPENIVCPKYYWEAASLNPYCKLLMVIEAENDSCPVRFMEGPCVADGSPGFYAEQNVWVASGTNPQLPAEK